MESTPQRIRSTESDIQHRVLAIITARGGSKGVPRKNITLLCGKPLLQYTTESALAAKTLTKVILSTDDSEIAEVGRRCGVDVPFIRPPELAGNNSPTLPVLQHAVGFLEERGETYDAICLLQPTNPLRQPKHIDDCIGLLFQGEADSVISVIPVPHEYNPHWVYFSREDGSLYLSTGEGQPIPRRQLLPSASCREGSIYIVRRNVLMNEGSLYGNRVLGYEMQPSTTVNINTVEDFQRAQYLMGQIKGTDS